MFSIQQNHGSTGTSAVWIHAISRDGGRNPRIKRAWSSSSPVPEERVRISRLAWGPPLM